MKTSSVTMLRVKAHLSLAVLLICTALVGCDRDDKVVVYTTPKEAPRAATTGPGMSTQENAALPPGHPAPNADMTPAAPAQGEIQWTVPQGWKQLPGDGQMRYASFQVSAEHPEVELSVIPLGAEAADLLPNVVRWEGQVGLPPSQMTDLPNVVKRVTVGDVNIDTVDLTGPESANPRLRMLAAIAPHEGQTWFFKLFGPAELIAAQKGKFDEFIKSIHFGGSPVPPQPAAPVASGAGGATWTIPAGWQQEPEKPMRVASFTAGPTELIITQFGRDNFGGLLPNINRWRNQAGLEPVADEKAATPTAMTVGGKSGQVYDFAGPANDPNAKRVHVAMIDDGEQVWFFKLVGPSKAVADQVPAFDGFLKSVSFK